MKTACFSIGLHLCLNNVEYKIDRITDEFNYYLIRESDGAIVVKNKTALLNALANDELVLHGMEKPKTKLRVVNDLSSLSLCRQKRACYRYEYVQAAIKSLGEVVTKKNLDIVIENVKNRLDDANPPSVSSVYRWWHKLIKSGNNIVALGGVPHKKTGHYAFSETVMTEVFDTIEEAYMKQDGETADETYNIFKHRIHQLNLARLEPLRYPSRATFYRMLTSISEFDRCAARHGMKAAVTKFRNTGGGPVVNRILERVEIDHSPLNMIVLDDDTGIPIGRPTLTCIIDCYSRMILGYYIGFETTSLVAVMRALRHAILPKDPTHKYMKTTEQAWPTYGIPHVLIVDNGMEFHADDLERIGFELGFDIQYCPKKEPRFKAKIERFFRTLNDAVSHNAPGTTKCNIAARGDYESEENAIYTESIFVSRITQ